LYVKTVVTNIFPNGIWQSTRKKVALKLKEFQIINHYFRCINPITINNNHKLLHKKINLNKKLN